MVAGFCPRCGSPTIPQSTVCTTCGGPLPSTTPLESPRPEATSTDPDAWRIPGYPESTGATAESRAADRAALFDLQVAALVAVLSFVVSAAVVGVGAALAYLAALGRASAASNSGAVVFLLGVLLFVILLGLVQLALYRRSFRTLARYDPVFTNPGSFALVAMVGLVVVGVLAVGIVALLLRASGCPAGNPFVLGLGGCPYTGLIVACLAFLVIAGASTAIGYIGVAIGVWRLAPHFDVKLFKLAAILSLLVSLAGAVLLLVAIRSARRRAERLQAPPS